VFSWFVFSGLRQARVAAAGLESPDRRGDDQQRASLHVDFLRINPIDRSVLQQRIGEHAVDVEDGGGRVRGVVQKLPVVMAEEMPEVRREDECDVNLAAAFVLGDEELRSSSVTRLRLHHDLDITSEQDQKSYQTIE
jgi:hypothetical protein